MMPIHKDQAESKQLGCTKAANQSKSTILLEPVDKSAVIKTTVKIVQSSSRVDMGSRRASTSTINITHGTKHGDGIDQKKVQKGQPSTALSPPKHLTPDNDDAMRSTSSLRRTSSERRPVISKYSISNLLHKSKDSTSRPGADRKRANSERTSSSLTSTFMGKTSSEKSAGKKKHGLSPLSTIAVAGSPMSRQSDESSVMNSRKRSSDQGAPTAPASPMHKTPIPKSYDAAEAFHTLEKSLETAPGEKTLSAQHQLGKLVVDGNPSDGHGHDPKAEGDAKHRRKSDTSKGAGSAMTSKQSMNDKFLKTNRRSISYDEPQHRQIASVELTTENLQALQGKFHVNPPPFRTTNTQEPEPKHKDTKSRHVLLQKDNRKPSSTEALADTVDREAASKQPHSNSVAGHLPKETPYRFSGKAIDDSVTSLSISQNTSTLNLMERKHTATGLGTGADRLDTKLSDQKDKKIMMVEETIANAEKGIKDFAVRMKGNMQKIDRAVRDSVKNTEKRSADNGVIAREFAVENPKVKNSMEGIKEVVKDPNLKSEKSGKELKVRADENSSEGTAQASIDTAKSGMKVAKLAAETIIGPQIKDAVATAANVLGIDAYAVAKISLKGSEAIEARHESLKTVVRPPVDSEPEKSKLEGISRNPNLRIRVPDEASLIKVPPYQKLRRRGHAESRIDFMKTQINVYSRFLLDFYLSQEHGWNHLYRTRLEFLSNKNKMERIREDLHLSHDQYIRYFG